MVKFHGCPYITIELQFCIKVIFSFIGLYLIATYITQAGVFKKIILINVCSDLYNIYRLEL